MPRPTTARPTLRADAPGTPLRLATALALLGTALAGPAAAAPAVLDASACAGLATRLAPAQPGLTLQAEWIPAQAQRPPGQADGPLLAAHCRLAGRMAERTGIDGQPYHIGFELRLPADWNGRLLYQGGGGNDGVVRPAVGHQAAPGYALNRGFAVVSTDAGHQKPTADFGFDPQARVDNAYAAHDRVATLAKALVQGAYAQPAARSYFIGCSGGGRQAMMMTQRFPQHFDGVLAIAPAMRVSKGATIAAAWDTQALQAIAPKGGDGQPVLSQALSDADLARLRDGILQACDAQDGLADGLVSHPAACRFDPAALQCRGAKTEQCLSAPQVGALQRIFAGARDSQGRALYFGWPWDAGIGHPANDWRAWKLGRSPTAQADSRHVFLMQDALQGYFVTPPDRGLSLYRFDFDRDPARMDAHAWMFNTADDVALTGFKARGGKLLLAHGMADAIFSAHETVDYHQRMRAVHGAGLDDFSRLFLVPGMGHCSGGAATDSFDGLQALVDWVEDGRAPARITARGTRVFPGRSRPLCPWPQHAHYNGQGDPEDERSFSCRGD
ncbi:tannase/feruloyl esterase family alpha/beta hydrolase [Ideonella livida]|uniref:Tannase/feruloyl esterase family alpha/beta hydrolase n=1 Tax=Ideonella livida TaxID=2707176 RepID=A0A7C9PJ70_9BURK|nr:tannase/feruloyl esterase family alpha/beta hydrolase [Ideonella livida]NDY92472.1 tannase/feruloyl esterase family alpha/beta hydrolase [Ideonella livida]